MKVSTTSGAFAVVFFILAGVIFGISLFLIVFSTLATDPIPSGAYYGMVLGILSVFFAVLLLIVDRIEAGFRDSMRYEMSEYQARRKEREIAELKAQLGDNQGDNL